MWNDNVAQLSYEQNVVDRFLGTKKIPTPWEKGVLTRHGVRRCPDCDEWTDTREKSLWSLCKRCENERLGDVAAG